VAQHAEEHGHREDGHRLVRSWPDLLEREQREDQGRQPPRAEPANEQDRVAVHPAADQGQGDRNHPHDREAEDGVDDDGPADVIEGDRHGDRPEGQPHQQGHRTPRLLQERELGGAAAAGRGAECDASAEVGDEPVPVHGQSREVGQQCQGEDGDPRSPP